MTKAIFLDRDGVINKSIIKHGKPYAPTRLEEFVLDANLGELARLRNLGYKLIIVTNQPDVGNGLVTPTFVESLHAQINMIFPFDEILACYHRSQDNCDCRKPKPGLLLQARDKFSIDMTHSYMAGDRWRDILAGQAAGCGTVFLDHGYKEDAPAFQPDFTCSSLIEAIEWIEFRTVQSQEKTLIQS